MKTRLMKCYSVFMIVGITFLALDAIVSIIIGNYLDAICNILYIAIAALNLKFIKIIVDLKSKLEGKHSRVSAELNDDISFHNQPEQG